jgi:hypothetical protein
MLCDIVLLEQNDMARGVSGRIVIEISPDIKQELYEQLNSENISLKSWFLEHVEFFLKGKQQLSLSLSTQPHPEKKADEKRAIA